MSPSIHPSANVLSQNIGSGTRIWEYVVVLPNAVIGQGWNICSHCLIENDVIMGNRVAVKSGVQLWDRLRAGDDDKFPRSKQRPELFPSTEIDVGESTGANATIMPGVEIGRIAMVGPDRLFTRFVPLNAIVVGNPARIVGYVDDTPSGAKDTAVGFAQSSCGERGDVGMTPFPELKAPQVELSKEINRPTERDGCNVLTGAGTVVANSAPQVPWE